MGIFVSTMVMLEPVIYTRTGEVGAWSFLLTITRHIRTRITGVSPEQQRNAVLVHVTLYFPHQKREYPYPAPAPSRFQLKDAYSVPAPAPANGSKILNNHNVNTVTYYLEPRIEEMPKRTPHHP